MGNIFQCSFSVRYDPALWNQYVAAQQRESRTNNLCEGWHRRFNLAVNKFHPSLYSLLRELQNEQAATESMIRDLDVGKPVREPQRKKFADLTSRLQRISLRYNDFICCGRSREEDNRTKQFLFGRILLPAVLTQR